MYLRSDERGPAMSNRLALRIALFGGVAVVLFAVLFFRLWLLQVLDGEKYLAEAKNNRTRSYRVSAPRGKILDRNGKVLVANRTSLALQVNPRKLPTDLAERRAELAHLAALTHSSLRHVRRTMHEELKLAPAAPVTLRRDVGHYLVFYLQENQDLFPGVEVQRVFVRAYPDGTLAAHLLGNVGEISEKQLKEPRYGGLQPGDEIGQEGVEDTYDRFLRGKPGLTRVQVDAFGEPTPNGRLVSKPPVPGDSLKLSIDANVQVAGESALAERGLPGGFVTMDVHTGEILGLGSFPTFEPALFTRPLTQKQVDETYRNELAPLADRAISGLYPTGSTFKLITALAALENGVITPSTSIYDSGKLTIGGESFQNAGGASYGSLTLVPALQVSSDVFFYELGLKMWDTNELQEWAHRLGIGRPSGIDLPGAAEGLLPSKHWRNQLYKEGETDRPWSAGDNIQLATGQGDLQTNPLQMAVAYSTLANGGTVVTPHVGKEVDDPAGRVLKEFAPRPRRHVKINPEYRSVILEGLHEAAQAPGGTSYAVFGGFPVPVAGKTGTAQRVGHADQSWYIVLAPYPNPKIVTAVTIEEGGFGAESAAPAALQILEAYFNKHTTGSAGPNGGSPG
ncbi:MAG TPA: penicillin-binding protein 2 [Solirubrobacterales bacterium]|jgi:penicillin-binding protein 2|nr:penicillin-binding protein 2 [Solirubrobacterales bacterium]